MFHFQRPFTNNTNEKSERLQKRNPVRISFLTGFLFIMFSYSASLNLPTRFFSPSDCVESSWLVAEVSSADAELL